jgi:hypothetical protein
VADHINKIYNAALSMWLPELTTLYGSSVLSNYWEASYGHENLILLHSVPKKCVHTSDVEYERGVYTR